MNYEKRIVCFIDILGFKKRIGETIDKDNEDIVEKINEVEEALSYIRKNLVEDEIELSIAKTKVVTQFSDSIVISFDYGETSGVFWTLYDIRLLLIGLINRKILCRGSITIGKVIHTDKLLFGPAIIEAYNMESKAAIYPRVLVSKDVIKIAATFKALHNTPGQEEEHVKSLLMQDSDGMYYVDFIKKEQGQIDDPECDYPQYLKCLSEIIDSGIKNSDPGIYVKYNWLKEKYMSVVGPIKERLKCKQDKDEILHWYSGLKEYS